MSVDSAKIVCIGDVHGHLDKLQSLWSNLQTALTEDGLHSTTVVFLGDYCDKGPDTKGVIDFLINLKQSRRPESTIFITGNHDFGMAAYIGCLPADNIPFDLDITRNHKFKKGFYTPEVEGGMHYMGRRWGGSTSHKSRTTFESYGVKFGYNSSNRDEFINAVPQEHKDFLRNLPWMYETYIPKCSPSNIICTHAGLGSVNVQNQLRAMRNRDILADSIRINPEYADRLYFMNGRREVLLTPKELNNKTLLISGHHGRVNITKNRIIMDNNAGKANRAIHAIVLPSRIMISSNN
jgi:hypothetical protein